MQNQHQQPLRKAPKKKSVGPRGRRASTLPAGDAPKKSPRSARAMNNEELWAMLFHELEELIAELEELCKCAQAIQVNQFYFK